MSTTIHPSDEDLSAYFDEELSPQQSSTIEDHLGQCRECQTLIQEFGLMAELGPLGEESLPGPAYWTDLPDRILARVDADDAVSPVPRLANPSFWQRLWNPQGAWKWVVGTAAIAVLVAGVWFGLEQQPNPRSPVPPEIAEGNRGAATGVGLEALENLAQEPEGREHLRETPQFYAQRAWESLGGEDNPETSLDIESRKPLTRRIGVNPPVARQVGMELSPLAPQTRAQADPVVSYGCGEDWAEQAFLAAMKAEESGEPLLAAEGYRVVRSNVAKTHPLYAEAHFRLNYLVWQNRLRQLAGIQRAQFLEKLNREASQRFENWVQTKGARDCREAWCMNRILLTLSGDVTGEVELQQTSTRMAQLKDCLPR